MTKSAKKMPDFRLTSVKAVLKHPMSFALPDIGQRPCLYGHPLEIQPDYVISR